MRKTLIALLLFCAPAWAQDRTSFDAYRKEIEAKNCAKAEEPAFTIFQCDAETTFYYFTKPLHPAHPSVVERALKDDKEGGFYIAENGRSFAPDAAQPAFPAWLAEFKALDAEMAKDVAAQQGPKPAPKP